MPTLLPQDADQRTIPVLRLKSGGAHTLAVGAGSTRNSAPFGDETLVIGVYATVPAFVRTGGPDVVAGPTDHYLPAGVPYDLSLGGGKRDRHTHIAVLRAEVDGTLYVSEKE